MELDEFIASNPDPRELKRAIAVQMRLQGFKHAQIQPVLGVRSSTISEWEQRYRNDGVEGLRLGYRGSTGYLSSEERAAVIAWIQQEKQRELWEVIDYIAETYEVTYSSLQSYYEILKAAGMSWQKGQKKAPSTTQRWCGDTTRKSQHG